MSCKRWRGMAGALVPVIALLALALVLAPTPAQAREYSIDEVVGDLTVNTNLRLRRVFPRRLLEPLEARARCHHQLW